MQTNRNKYYFLNIVFVLCLLVLILNDHFLKYQYSNRITGKLSDIAGIIMLPFLLAYLFPKLKQHAAWISAVLFIFWKTPISQFLIDLYNSIAFIQTSRIVDLTDLYVLLLLPVPHLLIDRIDSLNFVKIKKVNASLVLFPAILALMATSPPPVYYYTRTDGNLACSNCKITVEYNQDEIVEKLKNLDIVFDSIAPIDTTVLKRVPGLKKENVHVYRLNRLIIDKDTLKNIDFTMRTVKDKKTKIYFNGMQVSADFSTVKLENKLIKYYRNLLFKELKNKLKD